MNLVLWPTGNFGYPRGTHGRNGETIVAIVDHILQGWRAGYHAYLADPNRNSATFSVYQDGSVEQHVDLEDAAWCNGPMNNPDLSIPWIKRCWDLHINPNLLTVSIEHEGLSGAPMPEAQIVASIDLHKYILTRCPTIKPDAQHIVGHYKIDAVNKANCPGSAFPWTRLRAALAPVPSGGGGHPLGSPDVWVLSGAGPGLIAYCKATPAYGLPFLDAEAVAFFDADHNEYLKTVKSGRLYLHVYRAATGQIKTISW
jgi:hypothetical protein